MDFNVPNYDLSFDTPQPSLSPYSVKKYYEAGIFPQKISENIQDGFVWKKLSPEEKEELKKIIGLMWMSMEKQSRIPCSPRMKGSTVSTLTESLQLNAIT